MTTQELSNEFDLLYDNANNSAPGLDQYEKSVYLTQAQLELFKNKYGRGNRMQVGFEESEKRRTDLKNLITSYTTTIFKGSNGKGITSKSKFVDIPQNFCYAIQESATLDIPNCEAKVANVMPKTHDEYNAQINNPFRKPDSKTIWRLDFFNPESQEAVVELISEYDVIKYQLRYLRYPKPIILDDLEPGLSIEGYTESRTSELDRSIHSEILNRAVELAVRDYNQNELQAKLQTNLRNE